MPRQKKYDQVKVLENAMKAFWARGYAATSMNDLVKATGINRGSLYTAFPHKRALFMSVLQHYDQIYRVEHLQQISTRHSPADAIMKVFELAATKPADSSSPWGCLLVNTALELSPHEHEVCEFIEHCLHGVEAFFFTQIKAGKQTGEITTTQATRSAAQALLSLFLGLRVLTRAKTRQCTINAVTSQARMMLQ
jgi:TetR/AcrR family transcriptional repressor of nem operon